MPRPLPPHVLATAGSEAGAVRDHILDAAQRVIARRGLAGASTRAIAAEAGIGAGTVYNYFDNRLQLIAQSMIRRAHVLARPLADLPSRAGQGTVAGTLKRVARQVGAILEEMVPLIAAAFSDPELLVALRSEFAAAGLFINAGRTLADYLMAERDLGRIAADADCRAAASMILSLCHDRAFQHFLGGKSVKPPSIGKEIDFITRALAVSVGHPRIASPGTGSRR